MNQFLQEITGTKNLRQTGKLPDMKAVKPVLGEIQILKIMESGKVPPRVVILTALPVEFMAVAEHISDRHECEHKDGTIYERGQFTAGQVIWDVFIVETGQGNRRAATETQRAINALNPDIVLFVGIAGGRKDVEIGDVVAADKVYSYAAGRDEKIFKARPEAERPSYRLEQRARAIVRDWIHRKELEIKENLPSAYVGAIAAGENVVASTYSETEQRLRQHYGDALAVEKEGYGFLASAKEVQNVSALVIRGISDLLDDKEKTDQKGYQRIAANHASNFAFELLAKLEGQQDEKGIEKVQGSYSEMPLNKAAPDDIAVLRFQKNEDTYRLRAHHSAIEVFDETASQVTVPISPDQFGVEHSWTLETVGCFDDYKPKKCLIGKFLSWIRYLKRQQGKFSCLMIDESADSNVLWELLNIDNQPLGIVLQTVRTRPTLENEEYIIQNQQASNDATYCCQGQAIIYGPTSVKSASSNYSLGSQVYVQNSFFHDEPEQILDHLQKLKRQFGLIIMRDLALQKVTRFKRTAYLKRTKIFKESTSLIMLQLAETENGCTEHRDLAIAFLEYGAKGVLNMLVNVEEKTVQQIISQFFELYNQHSDLPIPEILRRLRSSVAEQLEEDLTNSAMSKLYLATFMYAYYGHPMTKLDLSSNY
ncbi:MAG: hypothetical protein ACFB2W_27485 [Leptolyngbyaceae cyanobacterium]